MAQNKKKSAELKRIRNKVEREKEKAAEMDDLQVALSGVQGKAAQENAAARMAEIEPKGKKIAVAPESEGVDAVAQAEVRKADQLAREGSPEHEWAIEVAMSMFKQFIVYEKDSPEEARIMLFPAFMHITREQIQAEIAAMYPPITQKQATEGLSEAELVDLKIIQEGIQDSISILKKRTEGAFPFPAERALNQLEYDTLCDLAWTETVLFYRMSEEDLLRGYIRLSAQHQIRANQPKGSRFRSWVSVRKFAALFIDVLNVQHEDMLLALIEKDAEINTGYARYFARWREAEQL